MTDTTEYFLERLQKKPVIAILRGLSPQDSVNLAQQAWNFGVSLVEVTLQDTSGYAALEAVVAAAPVGCDVGAGTITEASQVQSAQEAGARFGIAPGFDPETIRQAQHQQMPFLPGVATASEVQAAQSLNAMAVKAFPADVLTPAWVKAMRGPFPGMTFIGTGGIGGHNARQFLDAGASGVAISLQPQGTRLQEVCAALDS